MLARLLIPALLMTSLLFVCFAGCGKELTPQAQLLKDSSPEVYNKIMAMSDEELSASIVDTREKLRIIRSKLPPSIAGVSVDANKADDKQTTPVEGGDTVKTLALPLEVMKQEQERRK